MKLPFSLSLKFAFRLVLPGFVTALGLSPLLLAALEPSVAPVSAATAFAIVSLVLGWLYVLFDMQLYMLFEGRRYWPARIRKLFVALEERRLARLLNAIDRPDTDRRAYLEASVDLRGFPIGPEGEHAPHPTRLGNLLAGFEIYPLRVYGMDSVFYWPRIWVKLDSDLRSELDDQQALADSGLYVAAALYVDALLFLLYAVPTPDGLAPWVLQPDPAIGPLPSLVVAAGAALGGFVLYRGSLHAHAAFGELFKAVFDGYRDVVDVGPVVEEVRRISPKAVPGRPSARDAYAIAWRFLENDRLKIDGEMVPVPDEKRRRRQTTTGAAG